MASKYNDTAAVIQVIGCIYNDQSYLDTNGEYIITEDDFVEDFHKVVYGVIYKLHELGTAKITPETISDFLETRPKSKGVFNLNKGLEYLAKAKELSQPLAFDYYYKRLKKMSLLRAYEKIGVDVSKYYDPDNILDLKRKQVQEEWLDNTPIDKIADKVNQEIENVYRKYVQNDVFGIATLAGDGLEELITQFEKSPDAGVPLYGRYINTVTRGARLGKFFLRSAATGTGKAIPNNTVIPTPLGNRRVDEIKPGDYLFGQDGKPTKVLQIHPQPEKKDVWEVTFSNGTVAKCCGDHLWEYEYQTHRGTAWRVESTKQLYERAQKLKNGLKDSQNRGYRFHIKLNEAVEYSEKKYKLPPYIMGAFLGDGSFRYADSQKALTFSSENNEIPDYIASLLGEGYYAIKSSETNYSWLFKNKLNPKHNIWVEEFLSEYRKLWNVKSEGKFIPQEYLYGSVEQRYSLLQGLMDTDGSIDEKGRMRFTTISKMLRDDIITLCRSLGFIATYKIDTRPDQYITGECYNIHIQCKKELKQKCFHLPRKREKAIFYSQNGKRTEYKTTAAIIDIKKTENKADMTCFTVDNENHLFLMNDFIVTHNTRSMIADACYIACNQIYDTDYGAWVNNGKCFPTLFITTEQTKDEIQTMMLAFLSAVNEDHILYGRYEEGERERVFAAAKILKEAPLYIEELPEFNLQDVENAIKRGIAEHDIRFCFYDYIHTSIKILEEISRKAGKIALREDNILFMLSTRLKDICVKYGVFIMSATQLSGNFADAETPDQNLLRGAKSIADVDQRLARWNHVVLTGNGK